MDYQDTSEFLKKEQTRLLQASEFIISFYEQIFNSLVNLRDTLLNHTFPSDTMWKKQLISNITTLDFQEFQLLSAEGRMQNNSDFLVSVLNNIQAVLNVYLPKLVDINLQGIAKIIAANKYTWNFISRLYEKENITFLSGQQLEVAQSIKTSIKDRLENNIAPFFNYLEQIVRDEYRIRLRLELKKIIGVYNNYISNPAEYDKQIKQRCLDLNLEYNQELILSIIADLSKDKISFLDEIRARYRNEEVADQKKNVYRLKEIATRFVTQAGNISRLENLVLMIQTLFQPMSFFTKLMNFLKRMFTGKEDDRQRKDFSFAYSTRHGKLEQKHTTIVALLKNIDLFKSLLSKSRGLLDFHSYTKSSTHNTASALDNIIDNCITDLTQIYEECNGLREWLINPRNQKFLTKFPVARQEEFNDLLLAINYTLIINKQYLRDLDDQIK